jgi:hypothetical protein
VARTAFLKGTLHLEPFVTVYVLLLLKLSPSSCNSDQPKAKKQHGGRFWRLDGRDGRYERYDGRYDRRYWRYWRYDGRYWRYDRSFGSFDAYAEKSYMADSILLTSNSQKIISSCIFIGCPIIAILYDGIVPIYPSGLIII